MVGSNKGEQDKIIHAEPTKDFFITMLVKDIPLIRAIIDLVDNCLDGASRMRKSGNYAGLWIKIKVDKTHFEISDNCGGIPVDIARNYAFRFGRPKEMKQTDHSVGQFGVGMKRAIFKIGKNFKIKSTTAVSSFVVEEDVDVWKTHDRWEFTFKELNTYIDETTPEDQQGTKITVTSLHGPIAEKFSLENFQNRLKMELQSAHQLSMQKEIGITLNGIPLDFRPTELLSSKDLSPGHKVLTFDKLRVKPVVVEIYVGVQDSYPPSAGWYAYCNGRCVLKADQTLTTGWGEGDGKTIPKYHNTFARFRGYVFFDCDDTERLPWNTTKTGVDEDSEVYRSVRQTMITMMRPVIDFLNKLARETKEDREEKPFEEVLEKAEKSILEEANLFETFRVPDYVKKIQVIFEPRHRRIQYSRPRDKVEKVQKALNVYTLKEVGEGTFDYFYEMECEKE